MMQLQQPMTIGEAVRAMERQLEELDQLEIEARQLSNDGPLRNIAAIRAKVIANMERLDDYLASLSN